MNYLCPKCKTGNRLHVACNMMVHLVPDGTEIDGGDQEWDETAYARCGCGWHGHVEGFIKLEEGEGKLYACQDCETEFYENQLNPAKDLSERMSPGDVYTDVECPSCGALCYPI